ncbi:hypothetical protein IHN63_00145 [Deinococcus sp. 6YEL10]|uniref:hypothetical protein n=1 Tax=Deinococcus sp. 6YEL10 TaxID=2745870 RepID=UPI001E612A4C|nr:hypothetical protein [Deinococcus sp. 6YEL10]MCD0159708.1 hypothetical protein [Deinococcus sp. 6YEL10]
MQTEYVRQELNTLIRHGIKPEQLLVSLHRDTREARWGEVVVLGAGEMRRHMSSVGFSTGGMMTGAQWLAAYPLPEAVRAVQELVAVPSARGVTLRPSGPLMRTVGQLASLKGAWDWRASSEDGLSHEAQFEPGGVWVPFAVQERPALGLAGGGLVALDAYLAAPELYLLEG